MNDRPPGATAALRHRNFALAWSASVVSNTGSWLQQLAVPVVIYQITNSTLWLGISAFSGLVASALTILTGGLLADRYDRRRILIVTNLAQTIAAVALWVLWASGHARIGYLFIALIVGGLTGGIGVSAWQSIQPLLVPRELMVSAIRLNSTQYAISRAVGPAIGALVLRTWGPSACFALNAISFIGVAVAMAMVSSRQTPSDRGTSLRGDLGIGWRYVRASPALWLPCVGVIAVSFLAVTWTNLTAAMSDRHFGHPARDSGILVTGYGVGSVLASIASAKLFPAARRSVLFMSACLSAAAGLVLAAATNNFTIGIAGLFLLGVGHITNSMSLNTAIQLHAHESLRGRVLAIYLQGSLIGHATGSIVNAKVADTFSIRTGMLINATMLLVVLGVLSPVLRYLDQGAVVHVPEMDGVDIPAGAESAGDT